MVMYRVKIVGTPIKYLLTYATIFHTAALPSGPKADREPRFDLNLLPPNPPYELHVGNLPLDCSEEEVKEFFGPKVAVSRVRLVEENGRAKGFGFITLETVDSVRAAIDCHDKVNISHDCVFGFTFINMSYYILYDSPFFLPIPTI